MIEFNEDDFQKNDIRFTSNDFLPSSFRYKGNVDLNSKPRVILGDGSLASIRGMNYTDESGKVSIIPTISKEGTILNKEQAIDLYKKTGEHLGQFDSEEEANEYSSKLRESEGVVKVNTPVYKEGDSVFDESIRKASVGNIDNFLKQQAEYHEKKMSEGGMGVVPALQKLYHSSAYAVAKAYLNWNKEEISPTDVAADVIYNKFVIPFGFELPSKTLKMAGDFIGSDFFGEQLGFKKQTDYRLNKVIGSLLTRMGQDFEEAGKTVEEYLGASNIYKEKVYKDSFLDNPSLARCIGTVANLAPSLVGARATYKAFGELTAALMMAHQDVVDVYHEARQAGESEASAFGLYGVAFAGSAVLEKMGAKWLPDITEERLIKEGIERFSKRVTHSILSESSTEGLQTTYQNMVAKFGYDDSREIMSGVLESVILGGIGGGLMTSLSKSRYDEVKNILVKKHGLTEQDAETFIEVLNDNIKDNHEIIDSEASKNMAQFVKASEDYFAQLPQSTKQEYEKQFQTVREDIASQVKRALPEESDENVLAVSNSVLSRLKALAYVDAEKPSPLTAHEKYTPSIIKTTVENFLNGGSEIPFQNVVPQHTEWQNMETDKPKGAYVNGRVYLFEGADITTVEHEFAHAFKESLNKIGSESSQYLLNVVNEWEDKEFDRKYEVAKVGKDKYNVVNKNGRIIYDNMGDGFNSPESARDYAKNEIFAQGSETYMATSEAPSTALKNAFNAFSEFTKQVYSDSKLLDIQLSDNVNQFFGFMHGGIGMDEFLKKDVEEYSKKIAEEKAEREKEIAENVKETKNDVRFQTQYSQDYFDGLGEEISKIGQKSKKSSEMDETVLSSAKNLLKRALKTQSLRASEIHDKIEKSIQRMIHRRRFKQNDRVRRIEDFIKTYREIAKKDKADLLALDNALYNSNYDAIIEMTEKYPDLVPALNEVRTVLDEIYNELVEMGFNVGEQKDYFPRFIKDYKGFKQYTTGSEYSHFAEEIKNLEKNGETFTPDEYAEYINQRLRFTPSNTDVIKSPDFKQARKVDYVTTGLQQFYENPVDALLQYIKRATDSIEASRFLGKNNHQKGSIGELLMNLYKNGEIDSADMDAAQNLIRLSLETSKSSKLQKALANFSYAVSMNDPSSAITQLDDFWATVHNNGFWNSIKRVFTRTNQETDFDVVKTGVTELANELSTKEGALEKYIDTLFKFSGIGKVDAFGKNTFIQSDMDRMKKMSDSSLFEEIRDLFDSDAEARQTVKEIKNGEFTINAAFVAYYNLSHYQPLSNFDTPEFNKGNTKIFYVLRTYALKRIDTHLNNIRKGQWSKETKTIALMMLFGIGKDALNDLFQGKKPNIDDLWLNNMFGLLGLTKYNLWQAVHGQGIGTMIRDLGLSSPLLNFADATTKDFARFFSGERKLSELDSIKYIPFVGKSLYWHNGYGKIKKERAEKKNKKERLY